MRKLLVLVLAIVAIAPAAAWAAEFHTGWGGAVIDDKAFYDTNGALLPANQAFPRTTGHAVLRNCAHDPAPCTALSSSNSRSRRSHAGCRLLCANGKKSAA